MRLSRTPRFWFLALFCLLATLALGSALQTEAAEPEIIIYLKGGVGSIRANRTWTQGDRLCYESRGYQDCISKDRVGNAPVTEAPSASDSSSAGPPAVSETQPKADGKSGYEQCRASGKTEKQCSEEQERKLWELIRKTAERPTGEGKQAAPEHR